MLQNRGFAFLNVLCVLFIFNVEMNNIFERKCRPYTVLILASLQERMGTAPSYHVIQKLISSKSYHACPCIAGPDNPHI